ncbi:MAG: hypothetical protein H7A36_06625 [Chlamydiales bacterium]|nr:hypothetical protein [Chlamydiales bacterium]
MRILFCLLLLAAALPLRAECDKGVVILIHGFLQTEKGMNDVQRTCNYVGLKTYDFEYSSFKGSIREHGHCLAEFAKWVSEQNPGQDVNFVTHSLGALILRSACSDPAFPASAKKGRTVLFAPPSFGSEFGRKLNAGNLYRCLGFELGYELSTYTACDIMELGSYPDEMKILIIAGCRGSRFFMNKENDGVIAVDETGIDHPFYFETFFVTHYRILHYPPALNLARYFILDEYTDRDCE